MMINNKTFSIFLNILSQIKSLRKFLAIRSRKYHVEANNYGISNIAFIMDGNRRYGKRSQISDLESKKKGFEKMLEIAEFCSAIGIKEVSFFAFSLSNFNRSKIEVDNTMNLIVENKDKFKSKSMKKFLPKVNFFGRKDKLREDVLKAFKEVKEETKFNNHINLNIFFAYSSFDEIISSKNSKDLLYDKNIDILVRTSGELRLSDFLLKQCCWGTGLFFCKNYWPEFSILQLYLIVYKNYLELSFVKKFSKKIKY